MSNLFSALHISASSLRASQSAMSIISNNISNMNTEGYHRQKVNLGTLVVGGSIGNSVTAQVNSSMGVEILNVERYTSLLEGDYYNSEISRQGYLNKQQESAENIAKQFDEINGSGLESAINDMYTKLDNLNQYPTDATAKTAFLDSVTTLAETFNSLSNTITKQKTASVGDGKSQASLDKSELGQSIAALNQGLEDLADINKMLMSTNTGTLENNNLLDRRDSLLKELSQYAEFETKTYANGSVNLKLKGTDVVSGSVVNGRFDVNYTAEGEAAISFGKDNGETLTNINKKFDSGKIGGLLNTANFDNTMSELDTLAETFATALNKIQTRAGAYYFDGQKLSNDNLDQYKIFTTKDGSDKITASNISVNSVLTKGDGYNKLATAYFEDPAAVDLNSVGNTGNVQEFLGTKTELGEAYSSVLGRVSSRAESNSNAAAFQDSVVKSIDDKIKEQTGVDMNEEITELIKFQTAFEASSRVFNVCNEVLDTLMRLGE